MTLNGSIGIRLGLSGGLIMDKTGNVYFVRGGGIVSGLGGTVATGKFNIDTSEWGEDKFCEVISRGNFGFGMGLYGGTTISINPKYGTRELGAINGVSASMTYTDAK